MVRSAWSGGPCLRWWRRATAVFFALATAAAAIGLSGGLALAQVNNLTQLHFPSRPTQVPTAPPASNAPMLLQADEVRYDYTNNTVSAVGNVQIYYGGATIEADQVVYDQKTKRLRAEGNARLTEPDGRITYGQNIDLTDDYRDGFVELAAARDPGRYTLCGAARRSLERQLHGPAEQRLHRVRALQGRSAEAAAVAGKGGPDHPR